MEKPTRKKAEAPKKRRGAPSKIKPPLTWEQRNEAYRIIEKLRAVVEMYDCFREQIETWTSNLDKINTPLTALSTDEREGLEASGWGTNEAYAEFVQIGTEKAEECIRKLNDGLDLFRARLLDHCKDTKPFDAVLGTFYEQSGLASFPPENLQNSDAAQRVYRDLTSQALAKWLESKDDRYFESVITTASFLVLSNSILGIDEPFSSEEYRLNNQKLAEKIKAISESEEVKNLLEPRMRNDGTYERSGYRVAADQIVKELTGQSPPRRSDTRERRETKGKNN